VIDILTPRLTLWSDEPRRIARTNWLKRVAGVNRKMPTRKSAATSMANNARALR
jgi:hypothetical protein